MNAPRCLPWLALAGLAARGAEGQETRIRGFMDVTFNGSEARGQRSSFAIGKFDLYITSQLSERFSFLSETVFEPEKDFEADFERAIVTYTARPYFRVAVGQHHTPIGYWNTAYHHGTLLQPTITRPLLFLFEDEGGVLATRGTGLVISGRDVSGLHLGYDVMVANGTGSTVVRDNDAAKSYTLAVQARPISSLEVGVSAYFDRIARGVLNLRGDTLPAPVTQRLHGGFGVYRSGPVELIAEYQHITNRTATQGASRTDAFFVYGGYRVGNLVPYLRHDEIRYPPSDPYFAVDDVRLTVVGARYDVGATVVLKVEYRRQWARSVGAVSNGAAQVAVAF